MRKKSGCAIPGGPDFKRPRIAVRITWVVMAENSFFEASRAFLRAVKSETSTIPRDP